jgi:hypothetical protein
VDAVCGEEKKMLAIHSFPSTSTVMLIDGKRKLPTSVESEVDNLWQAEQRRRGTSIFNGNIFSAVEASSRRIIGRVVEYRHLIAQMARPELYDALQVRPVAVSGLFECADGIVFGRRSDTMMQDAGLWELVPSGGLDTSNRAPGEVDYRAQLLTELDEEIGIGSDAISSLTPFCLVEDLDSHVLDIGIAMVSPLSADAMLRIHREAKSNEYEELRVVPVADMAKFIRGEAAQLVGVSAALIDQFLK